MGLACGACHVLPFAGPCTRNLTCYEHRQPAGCVFGAAQNRLQHSCCRPLLARQSSLTFRSGSLKACPSSSRFARHIVRASSGGDNPQESSQTAMSPEEAYQLLGVRESANFEQIMTAKKNLVNKAGNNQDRKTQLEMAYDTLLMQAMKKRLRGEVAGQSVRFADVPKRRAAGTAAKQAIKRLPGGIEVRQTPKDDLVKLSAGFAVLGGWSLLQGLTNPAVPGQSDIPGLQLALAVAVSIYSFRERKKLSLTRAGGITVAGLALGLAVGSGAQGLLRVDIIPIGGLSSPGVLVSEFALAGLWAATAFLA